MELLIIRSEIVCAVTLAFLIIYYNFYNISDSNRWFTKIAVSALAHVVFDIITVITVNNLDTVPIGINKALHIILYLTGMIFMYVFYQYVIYLTIPLKTKKRISVIDIIPILLFIICSFFVNIEYVHGNGTYYSFGPLVFIGYGVFACYCLMSTIILILRRRRIDQKVRIAIFPMITVMLIMITIQIIIPELLMTGAGATLVSVGVFVALDNPASKLRDHAYRDIDTGVKNKNSYEEDIKWLQKKVAAKYEKIGCVICDLNGLKLVNDTYGHLVGDEFIRTAANIIRDNFLSAYDIYRIGGDEFAVLYVMPKENEIIKEIENVRASCEKASTGRDIPISIAIGYAISTECKNPSDCIIEAIEIADKMMYADKLRTKAEHPELVRK